jgi:hypothetical protein
MKDISQGGDIVIFIKSFRLRCYGQVERMQNQRMPKQVATATVEGTRKRGRPSSRWRDEVEEDLNIMGMKTGRQAVARNCREWRKIALEAKAHKGL